MSSDRRSEGRAASEIAHVRKVILYLWVGAILIGTVVGSILWKNTVGSERPLPAIGIGIAIAFAATTGMSWALLAGSRLREREDLQERNHRKRHGARHEIAKAVWGLWLALILAVPAGSFALWYWLAPRERPFVEVGFVVAVALVCMADISLFLLYGMRRPRNETPEQRNRRASRLAWLGLIAVVVLQVIYFTGRSIFDL